MVGTNRLHGWCLRIPWRDAASASCAFASRHRHGFSLIELLVVIGIIGIVIAILLPVLARTRASAMKVICAGRLRDLTLACRMYSDDEKVYPPALQHGEIDALGRIVVGHKPHQVSTTLLNQLRPYLKFPEVTAATEASKLPPFVQCPFTEEKEVDRGPVVSMLEPHVATYYTGYAYLARLEEQPVMPPVTGPVTMMLPVPVIDAGHLLQPNRCAAAKDKRRAVLWADHVYRSEQAGGFWQYTHARSPRPGPLPLTYKDHAGLVGQHRAFTDASVEWVGAGEPGLDVGSPQLDKTAAFKTTTGERWWF
jgi:prepilin-type N-terminal cleavage/methylation domain-containing protein